MRALFSHFFYRVKSERRKTNDRYLLQLATKSAKIEKYIFRSTNSGQCSDETCQMCQKSSYLFNYLLENKLGNYIPLQVIFAENNLTELCKLNIKIVIRQK